MKVSSDQRWRILDSRKNNLHNKYNLINMLKLIYYIILDINYYLEIIYSVVTYQKLYKSSTRTI